MDLDHSGTKYTVLRIWDTIREYRGEVKKMQKSVKDVNKELESYHFFNYKSREALFTWIEFKDCETGNSKIGILELFNNPCNVPKLRFILLEIVKIIYKNFFLATEVNKEKF